MVSSDYLHRDQWVVALRADIIHPPGRPEERLRRVVLEDPGAVVVLAVDAEDRVCLLRQYRHPGTAVFTELPAGLCDVPGEDPMETARRELREEVQLEASEWTPLMTSFPSVGITDERHHLFLARGLTPADRGDFELRGEEAEMEMFWAPFDDVVAAVLDGRIQEGPLALAVLLYDARRRRGLVPPGPPDADGLHPGT